MPHHSYLGNICSIILILYWILPLYFTLKKQQNMEINADISDIVDIKMEMINHVKNTTP